MKHLFLPLFLMIFSEQILALSDAAVHRLSQQQKRVMAHTTWHPDCPVALDDLRMLSVPYWGTDKRYHLGHLVVHKDVVSSLSGIFVKLAQRHFPIAHMAPMYVYKGDDILSMSANNTSAFNCRLMTGSASKYSVHSDGKAIDINPLWNPYVSKNVVLPIQAKAYQNRHLKRPGIIHERGLVHRLFIGDGWSWGGAWHSLKDYQHFEYLRS
jgi:hypothetical protein